MIKREEMKKVTNVQIIGISGILILIFPVVTVAGDLSNMSSFVITQEDMEPNFKLNDVVMSSNSTSFDNLSVGDVIVFRAPKATTDDGKPKVIVHRISEIGTTSGKQVVITKGDASPYSIPGIDFPIFIENYIGKVVSVTRNNNTLLTTNDETETRTFEDCFSEGMGILTLALIFAPTDKLSAADLIDPAFKKMIINLCNFYHEKTGTWVELTDKEQIDHLTQLYGKEFYQKYRDTYPEKLEEFFTNRSR
jgi:signal peptidase I